MAKTKRTPLQININGNYSDGRTFNTTFTDILEAEWFISHDMIMVETDIHQKEEGKRIQKEGKTRLELINQLKREGKPLMQLLEVGN